MDCSHVNLTHKQMIAYLCMQMFSGLLSLIGSSLLIYLTIKNSLTRLHNRLIFCMSFIDILSSLAWTFSTIPTPRDLTCTIGYGNLSTCTAQGFVLQLGNAVPTYNAMLSIYFLLVIRYGLSEANINKKYEILMHSLALIPSLGLAIAGASMDLYFSDMSPCWVYDDRSKVIQEGQWLVTATLAQGLISAFILFYCMIKIYTTMRFAALQYTGSTTTLSGIEISAREAGYQAFLYCLAYTVTYSWIVVSIIAQILHTNRFNSPSLYFLTGIFLPLQGFWNLLAYTRPRVSALMMDDPSLSYKSAMYVIIFFPEGSSA